jgi:hypothetical protein
VSISVESAALTTDATKLSATAVERRKFILENP